MNEGTGTIENDTQNLEAYLKQILKFLMWKPLNEYKNSIENRVTELVKTNARKELWRLCNGKYNMTEIASTLNRELSNISPTIKLWVENNIVFEITKEGSKYPVSIEFIFDYLISSFDWSLI